MKVDFLPDKQSSLSFVSVSVGFFQKVLAILFWKIAEALLFIVFRFSVKLWFAYDKSQKFWWRSSSCKHAFVLDNEYNLFCRKFLQPVQNIKD